MFQVTFSEQSLSILNSLTQGEQLVLMEKLSSLSSDILDGNNQEIGKFNRKGKSFTDFGLVRLEYISKK